MGEAKRRKGQGRDTFEDVQGRLRELGIDTSRFGFYDSEPFLRVEKADPEVLEQYARWVMLRPRDPVYEAHARDIVPRLATLMAETLRSEGMHGGCFAAAGMMSRMLDRLGVWSFGVHGCLTLEVKSRGWWLGFAKCDDVDFEDGMPGHSWVVAPPYSIVDASLMLQRLDGDPMQPLVPASLLCDTNFKLVRPDITDVVADRVREYYAARERRYDPQLHYRLEPRLRQFGQTFPAMEVAVGELQLRYVPTAIRLTDVSLDLINSEGKVGRPGIDIWRETIAPAFGIEPHTRT
jgi:hypothetical protein